MRRLLIEYLHEFKENKSDKRDKSFMYMYFYLLLPFVNQMNILARDTDKYFIMLLAVLIPSVVICISVCFHPAKLSKIQYLCPLSFEERKNKIRDAYIFRVCIHLIVSVIGLAILELINKVDLFCVFIVLFNDIMLSILIYPSSNKKGTDVSMGTLLFYVVMVMACVSNIILVAVFIDNDLGLTAKWVIMIMFAIIFIPPYFCNLKYIKRELIEAIDFE